MAPMADGDENSDSEEAASAQSLQPGEGVTVPSWSDQHSISQLLNFHQEGPHVGSGDAKPEASPHSRVVNVGADNEMVVFGYRWSLWRAVPSTLLGVLTGGLLLLPLHCRPQWQMRCFCAPCPLQDAEHVLIKTTDEFQQWHRQRVRSLYLRYSPWPDPRLPDPPEAVDEFSLLRKNISFSGVQIRYVQHQSVRYIWDPSKRNFVMLRGLEQNVSCLDLHKYYQDGLVYQESQNRKLIYGPNVIAVQVPPYRKLLGKEILNPYYGFQAFSVILWFVEAYYPYAVAIIVLSISSIALSLYTARRQYAMLHDMVRSHSSVRVSVLRRGGAAETVSSAELVPGDVILLPEREVVLPCDAVLLTGSVVVNESMLTGESVPVTKTPLPELCDEDTLRTPIFRLQDYRRHVLFCGTHTLRVRPEQGQVRAVVIRTGFLTTKGQLVRSILFPKPVDFKLLQDARRFVACLVLTAVLGCIYTVVISSLRREPVMEIVLKTLDIVTIVVPPALPAVVTVGVVYAQRRLKSRGVHCISPHRINLCGQLDLVCFDKTGTLTESGMDLHTVVPAKNKSFLYSDSELTVEALKEEEEVLAAMATCHSLTLTSSHTSLQGEPLDLALFRATSWILEEMVSGRPDPPQPLLVVRPTRMPQPGGSSTRPVCRSRSGMAILRQFPFSSSLQRMTVIAKDLEQQRLVAYSKGAPETVVHLCSPDSAHCTIDSTSMSPSHLRITGQTAVPDDFQEVMESFMQRGYRVVGLAFRDFTSSLQEADIKNVKRMFVEQDMTFAGLVVLENRLKKVTSSVFRELLEAKIRLVMVTGSFPANLGIVSDEHGGRFHQDIVVVESGQLESIIPVIVGQSRDSTLTAVQAARESGMIGNAEKVIRVKAKSPTATSRASVSWNSVREPQSQQESPLSANEREEDKSRIHLVIDGPSLAVIEDQFPELLPKVTLFGTVFARMSPDMKTNLIKCLQSLECYSYVVGMCGDGANDCGALKTAHVGISLSQLEASVASPFTSKLPTIECIPILIKEGRAALVTSFCAFKYMALYSMIQYVSVLILYYISSNLGNWEFLYEDLFITSAIAISMSRNQAYEHLVPQRPNASLVSPQILVSVLMHIGVCTTFQLAGFHLVQVQPWYHSWDQGTQACLSNDTLYEAPAAQRHNNSGVYFNRQWKISNYINTTVFFVSVFQYITIAFVFSVGKPFRKPISTNYLFLAALVTLYLFTLFLMLFPSRSLDTFFQFVCIPYIWRIYILLMVIAHFALSVLLEETVTNNRRLWDWLSPAYGPSASPLKHRKLHQELQSDPSWPPLSASP